MKTSGSSAPTRIALDTSAYSHFRAGHEEILTRIAEAGVVLVPTVVLGELEAGFRLGRRTEENRVALAEFLGEPFVSVIPVTADVARIYGRVFVELRQAGSPVPVNDIWIAASTIDAGAHLLTFDRDFERIASLDLSCYAVETSGD